MVLLAGSFGNDPDPDMGGVGGTDFYVPVYATATIASMGFLGLPLHLASDREAGVLRRYRAAGAHRGRRRPAARPAPRRPQPGRRPHPHGLVDAVSDPWHGRSWDAPALAGLGPVTVAAVLATAWHLRRE